jgi:HD superfamily phosphohydrolase
MSKGPIQRIQDSIHGLMEFRGMETLVVDVLRTPELQRLRRIRQLGLAHLVFPGAEHSRLVHSLGAAWLAVRFGRQLIDTTRGFLIDVLRPSPSSIRDFAVAALCHDLGHGPLSHAWEREVIGDKYDFDKWAAKLGLNDNLQDSIEGC